MNVFYSSLRNGVYKVKYASPYDPNWTDTELLANVVQLSVPEDSGLTELPNLPNAVSLNVEQNPVAALPDGMLKLEELFCCGTNVTTLPPMPNLEYLACTYCANLTALPDFPKLKTLMYFGTPGLTTLPAFPNLTYKSHWP